VSFPKYQSLRDSCVEWIGEVPSHWAVQPLKRHARLLTVKTDRRDHPVALENIESWTGRFVPTETEFEGEGVAFDAGDVLFGKLRPYLAKTLVAESSGEAVGDFLVMRPAEVANSRFVAYQLRSREVISIIDGSTFGSKMPRASWDFVGSMPTALPPPSEQAAIVTFLDRETAKIDALVEEQKRLIELLKEKRQAVISQAVTKGLENVPMKDSGVEWLGKVPAHWEVVPLMRLTQQDRPIMYGIVLPGPDVGDGVPILKGGNVRPVRLRLEVLARTTAEIELPYARARLRSGDLVYSIRGTIGDCEIVPNELEGCNITQDVARVSPAAEVDPEWLRYALLSDPVAKSLAVGSLGAAVRGVNIYDLKRARIPVPPKTERNEIGKWISSEVARKDALVSAAERGIDLLLERRSALISAAVTGKIDVRGLAQH
jgi:type I restriction enzyme S subunit